MSKDTYDIVDFHDGTYALRRTNEYGSYQFLCAKDWTFWWASDYVEHAKTTNFSKLRDLKANKGKSYSILKDKPPTRIINEDVKFKLPKFKLPKFKLPKIKWKK